MSDDSNIQNNIQFLDDPITMIFPFGDFRILKGKLWTDPQGVEKQLPDRFNYCVNLPGYGEGRDAEKFWLKADDWLHWSIQHVGIGRGTILTIRRRVNPDDKKKKYWEVVKDGQIFRSLDLPRDNTSAPQELPKENPPHPADTSSSVPGGEPKSLKDAYEKGYHDGQRAGNGHAKTAPADLPAQIGAVYVVAFKVARAALILSRIEPTDEQVATTGRGLEIDLIRVGWRARPERVQEVIRVIKEFDTDRDQSQKTVPSVLVTDLVGPAGSGPVGGDILFDLYEQAKEAEIEEAEFTIAIREIVAKHLKVKCLPPTYDLTGMPVSCTEQIVAWINDHAQMGAYGRRRDSARRGEKAFGPGYNGPDRSDVESAVEIDVQNSAKRDAIPPTFKNNV